MAEFGGAEWCGAVYKYHYPAIICSTTKESQNKASPAQISTLLDLLPVNHHTECISTPQRATFRRPHFDTNPPRST